MLVAACGFSPHAAVDGRGSGEGSDSMLGQRHRQPLTLTVESPTMLADFVASVVIENDAALTMYAPDPGQIAFTAMDGTPLSREIVAYDHATGSLEAWVRIPMVGDAITIYMSYGPGEPAEPMHVWDGFTAAWHFSEIVGPFVDSAAAHAVNAPTPEESPTPTSFGIVGAALSFDGVNGSQGDYTSTGTHDPSLDFGMQSFTVQTWVFVDSSANAYDEVLYNGGDNEAGYAFLLGTSNWVASVSDGSDRFTSFGMEPMLKGHWNQLTAVADRTSEQWMLYLNGAFVTQVTTAGMGMVNSTTPLDIGRGVDGRQFKGTVDEVRLARSAYSADRIAAEYRNAMSRSTFQQLGSDEAF